LTVPQNLIVAVKRQMKYVCKTRSSLILGEADAN